MVPKRVELLWICPSLCPAVAHYYLQIVVLWSANSSPWLYVRFLPIPLTSAKVLLVPPLVPSEAMIWSDTMARANPLVSALPLQPTPDNFSPIRNVTLGSSETVVFCEIARVPAPISCRSCPMSLNSYGFFSLVTSWSTSLVANWNLSRMRLWSTQVHKVISFRVSGIR